MVSDKLFSSSFSSCAVFNASLMITVAKPSLLCAFPMIYLKLRFVRLPMFHSYFPPSYFQFTVCSCLLMMGYSVIYISLVLVCSPSVHILFDLQIKDLFNCWNSVYRASYYLKVWQSVSISSGKAFSLFAVWTFRIHVLM